jgi:hypothetical protein
MRGFTIGNSGAAGIVNTEDRTTYMGRAHVMPYDALLQHELAHTYIGNESLTQFLEMFAYDVLHGSPRSADGLGFRRNWVPMAESNKDSAAVLDVYHLVGHDAMSDACRAIYPLRPPYGSPLPPAVRDVFVGRAPAAWKTPSRRRSPP